MKQRGGVFVVSARAESNDTRSDVVVRDWDNTGNGILSLNGRTGIWKDVILTYKEHPDILLYGRSMKYPQIVEPLNDIRMRKNHYTVAHCHNTLLHTIMEVGIPGALLYLGFIAYFFFYAIKLMTNKDAALWERLTPIPAIGLDV